MMIRLSLLLSTALLSIDANAQIKFLGPSDLRIEIESAQVVDVENEDVPWDETHTYNMTVYANLELKLKIKDAGCGLKEDSTVFIRFEGDDLGQAKQKNRTLNFFLIQKHAAGGMCTSTSNVVKAEKIVIPLVNGVSAGADKNITYRYLFKTVSSGNNPLVLAVKVNQLQKLIEIQK